MNSSDKKHQNKENQKQNQSKKKNPKRTRKKKKTNPPKELKPITVAACQMNASLGNIPENLEQAERLIRKAFHAGARWVILPEFFPTALALHPTLEDAALPIDSLVLTILKDNAKRFEGYVGGSFLCSREQDRFNTFVLVDPDGEVHCYDKNLLTMWEHCYTRTGKTNGIVKTEDGIAGVALSTELIRSQTIQRLKGKVDFVIAGSCWGSVPEHSMLPFLRDFLFKEEQENLEMVKNSPGGLAQILGVPLIHAAHSGVYEGTAPYLGISYRSHYLGESQIVDGTGKILARLKREEGEGVLIAEITPGALKENFESNSQKGSWITHLPRNFAWFLSFTNRYGKQHYRKMKKRGFN